MALELPDDKFIDHITWESRGYRSYEIAKLAEAGFTPVTSPGALAGVRYSEVFRRKAEGFWGVRGVNNREGGYDGVVTQAVQHLGVEVEEHRGMFSSRSWNVKFLDGVLRFYGADVGFSGPPTLNLSGNKALRLVCHRLGITQPRQFPDEDHIPSLAALEAQLRSEVILSASVRNAKSSPP